MRNKPWKTAWLPLALLALGLLAGLVTGLGLKGLRGLFGPRS